jgi:hypothetical protein
MSTLTERQAFAAMMCFLEAFYAETRSDDVGGLLGAMLVLPDGGTADPALWERWLECIQKVAGEEGDPCSRMVLER